MIKLLTKIKTTAILFFAFTMHGFSTEQNQHNLAAFQPGQYMSPKIIDEYGENFFFTCTPIPDSVFNTMKGKSYKATCTVPRQQLRYLRCLHKDKYGNIFIGEMIVNVKIASKVLNILRELYSNGYPIERMRLIDCWNADDESAMKDNNSSCFNFRFVSHTRKVSKHGQGLAIDINTLYNPYYRKLRNGNEIIEPSTGKPYLNRSKKFDYKIEKGDLCYRLFTQAGFRWGGDWVHTKDYQHFEY